LKTAKSSDFPVYKNSCISTKIISESNLMLTSADGSKRTAN